MIIAPARSQAAKKRRREKPAGSFVSASQRQAKLLLHLSLSISSTYLVSLSLFASHGLASASAHEKTTNPRGQGKSREEKRVASAPPIPFRSNRRRRLARDPLRVPRRGACPSVGRGRGVVRSTGFQKNLLIRIPDPIGEDWAVDHFNIPWWLLWSVRIRRKRLGWFRR